MFIGENTMEIEAEVDSNAECSHDERPTRRTGMSVTMYIGYSIFCT